METTKEVLERAPAFKGNTCPRCGSARLGDTCLSCGCLDYRAVSEPDRDISEVFFDEVHRGRGQLPGLLESVQIAAMAGWYVEANGSEW